MKFKLGKASNSCDICYVYDDKIEFNTLEELVNWVNGLKCQSIIMEVDEGSPAILIYDARL